jgi:hypothetical protein
MKRFPILLALFVLISFNGYKAAAQNVHTAIIDGTVYKAILYGDQSLSIKTGNKTVFHAKRADLYLTFEPLAHFTFTDFNGDGYPDLVLQYRSNVPGRNDLILYERRLKKFIQVQGFSNYPEAKRLTNTSFYYGYHASGCADLDWDSDLFKIENDKIIAVGNISGRLCESSSEPKGIFINKKTGKKLHQLKTLPGNSLNAFNGDKMQFIDHYWAANYKSF